VAILSALYWANNMPMAVSTASAPTVLSSAYLRPASTATPSSIRYATRAAPASELISRKMKKLNKSPVTTMPRTPAISRNSIA